jgi:RHS repeat-associated protein
VNTQASDRTLSFTYGPEHQRIKQITALAGNGTSAYSAGTVWYLNGEDGQSLTYEKEIKTSGITEHKHYLQAAGITFAMMTKREGASITAASTGNLAAQQLRYFQQDHLVNTAVITDEAGAVVERLAYNPWGKRRFANGLPDPQDSIVPLTTDRGYTEHEHLDEVGVIHMNGRIYDPLIGRFMSADPFIQAPFELQSHNRYAYVMNNPLAFTDPSGYFSWGGVFRSAVQAGIVVTGGYAGGLVGLYAGYQAQNNPRLQSMYISVGSLACGGWAPVCNGFGQGMLATSYGASESQAWNIGARAGFTTWAFQAAGDGVENGSYAKHSAGHYAAHATAGCVSSVANGGKCGTGAASAVVGLGATHYTSGANWNAVSRGVVVSVAGGVASVIGGGKFSNGAMTAAYGYLFNELAHDNKRSSPFFSGVKDGVTSYADGLAEVAVHRMALSGAFGETAMQQAQGYANTVSDAIDWAAQNPKVVAQGVYVLTANMSAEESRYTQAKIGAKMAFGTLVSVGTSGVGAVLVPTAAYGNMLEAAKRGAPYMEIIKRGGIGY